MKLPVLLLLSNTIISSQLLAASCPVPVGNAAGAFTLIQDQQTGRLADFLENSVVSRTALNEKCEDMYQVALRLRNEEARKILESMGFAPMTSTQLNVRTRSGKSYYEVALAHSPFSVIELLHGRGARLVNASLGEYELIIAAKSNSVDVVEAIYRKYPNQINTFDRNGKSALSIAAQFNKLNVVKTLIQLGADIRQGGSYGNWLPLSLAAAYNTSDVVQYLIKLGSDVNHMDTNKMSVLGLALSSGGHLDNIKLLIEAGADLTRVDMSSSSLNSIHLAVRSNNIANVNYLIRLGEDLEFRDYNQKTPLIIAVQQASEDIIGLLISAGADRYAKDKHGKRAHFYAVERMLDQAIISQLL